VIQVINVALVGGVELRAAFARRPDSYAWECHDCRSGVVIPEECTNSHGERVNIDPINLPKNPTVLHF
jgi:hypothetical protein